MKTFFRLVVFGLCLLNLFALFGCGKGKPFILDGPDMERTLWREFTISQTSDVYEENFSYTVKYDETEDKGYLYMEVPHETKGYPIEKSIQLKSQDVNALINMNILSFTDTPIESSNIEAEILDGTFLEFSVTDINGNQSEKILSKDKEVEILSILKPYADKLSG